MKTTTTTTKIPERFKKKSWSKVKQKASEKYTYKIHMCVTHIYVTKIYEIRGHKFGREQGMF